MRIERCLRLLPSAVVGVVLLLGLTTGARAAFVIPGAEYLLTIQDTSGPNGGGFFHDASPTTFYASTQGQMGLGMLTAYQQSCETSCNSAYLNSAIALGNAMTDPINHAVVGTNVQQNELYFDAGNTAPIVWSQNTLFLQRLSMVTGNTTYNSFVQTNLWDKLNAGTYGNDPLGTNPNRFSDTGGVNASGWVAVSQSKCADFSPWCLAKPAVAASLAGQTAITNTFMNGIKLGLEAVTDSETTTFGLEVLGLAAAIWASEITGIDIDPTSGIWASADSTSDLATMLLALQDASGAFPAGLYTGAPATDVEATGVAILALALSGADPTKIQLALEFLQDAQAGNGCVEMSPGICDDGLHAEVLQYYSEVAVNDPPEGTPGVQTPGAIVGNFYSAPEPLTVALFGVGLAGLAVTQRRRRAA
jgi:hypothetical protein